MKIENWTRIDNLPLGIGDEFSYIREEAELLGDVEEWEVCLWVEEKFEKDFPELLQAFRFDDVISVEYYLFERDYDMVEDAFSGYAVYIHMHKELVEKMYNHVIDKHPDYVLSYLHWLEKPLEVKR